MEDDFHASVNVPPFKGNKCLRGATVCLFQYGRDLEVYVESLNLCHHATCNNVCLMEAFRCGLDKDLIFFMPRGDLCWTLKVYISFALWVNGLAFTVDKAEDYRNLD